MRTIWKFALTVADSQVIEMPREAKILSAQMQGESLSLWAEVIPERARTKRIIEVYGTGHTIEDDADLIFIGTVQMLGGQLIFHVFERLSR